MTPRQTITGRSLENTVLPVLRLADFDVQTQKNIGQRLGGGEHFVDAVACKGNRRIIISSKWQQTDGTAEQKVPFEVLCLLEALSSGEYTEAYLVLGGVDAGPNGVRGWKLRSFYLGGGLNKYIPDAHRVKMLTLEGFVAEVNRWIKDSRRNQP